MPLDPSAVSHSFADVPITWNDSSCLLYALSVGAGPAELQFTTENTGGVPFSVLPSMAAMLCQPPLEVWERVGDFDWTGLVHAQQDLWLHKALAPAGTGVLHTDILAMYDKGTAALVKTRTILRDSESKDLVATGESTIYIRGAGGWGGDRGSSTPETDPRGEPHHRKRHTSYGNQALLYRINGDRNPLHSDPKFAAKAGFDRPIMHGLGTLGFATRALVEKLCPDDPSRIEYLSVRFATPSFPGDDFVTSIWRGSTDTAQFRTERGTGEVALNAGKVRLRSPQQ